MSHLHLVDGVLSPLWWVTGWIITLIFLGYATSKVKKEEAAKRVPYLGVIAALMLITMSIPLGFLPFHLNLTVLAGILAGPWLGFIAVFIVNLILAFIAHGGITVLGLNTLIIGSEVILGYYLFNFLKERIRPVAAVAITVVLTLLLSTSLMVGVVTISEAGLVSALPHEEHAHEEEGIHEEETAHENEAIHAEENAPEDTAIQAVAGVHAEEELHEEGLKEVLAEIEILNISGWSAVAAILFLGITIEALATALVIGYFLKVRADLILPKVMTDADEIGLIE